eukprot:gene53589-73271_t
MRAGFSLDFSVQLDALTPGQVLLDNRTATGQGLHVVTTATGTLRLVLNDGREESAWESDRGAISAGRPHHVVITVDGGPKIITFIIDGVLNDGGTARQFGWGRFSPTLRSANGAATLKLASPIKISKILTDNGSQFTDRFAAKDKKPSGQH